MDRGGGEAERDVRPPHPFGRRVLYAIEDLETWAKARACEMTSDPTYGAR
jgi:hypothetical protein